MIFTCNFPSLFNNILITRIASAFDHYIKISITSVFPSDSLDPFAAVCSFPSEDSSLPLEMASEVAFFVVPLAAVPSLVVVDSLVVDPFVPSLAVVDP